VRIGNAALKLGQGRAAVGVPVGEADIAHAGLELMHRFLRQVGFLAALRAWGRKLSFPGDLPLPTLVRLVVGMLLVGARRLRHLAFIGNEALLQRFVGLSRMPTDRSLGRALIRMNWRVWPALDRLSQQLVHAGVERLGPRGEGDAKGCLRGKKAVAENHGIRRGAAAWSPGAMASLAAEGAVGARDLRAPGGDSVATASTTSWSSASARPSVTCTSPSTTTRAGPIAASATSRPQAHAGSPRDTQRHPET
jgi:hypothetical protein